jgi:HlyD family secretion protein
MLQKLRLMLAAAVLVSATMATGCGLTTPGSSAPETTVPVQVTISRGDVTHTVTASGTLTADTTSLAFEISGRVASVLVSEGSAIAAGDPIATLDEQPLEDAILSAEFALRSATVQLQQASEPSSEADLASARAALSQAQVALNTLYEDPTETDRQEAQLRVDQARNSLWAAQASRDAAAGNPNASGASVDGAEAAVLNAEVAVQQALLAQNRLGEPPVRSAVAGAQAQVASALANLDRLLEQPNSLAIASAEIGVEQAELALKQAQDRLANATLRAPFAGVLTSVTLAVGEYAVANQPVAVLAKPAPIYVTAMIDEIDVVGLAQGQRATVTFDALGNREYEAELTFLAPQGRATAGIPAYEARISMADNDSSTRLGMSANVEVIIAEAQNAILVPNQALIANRDTGQYFVTVATALGSRKQEVVLGIQGEDYAEVLEGLSEGDTVELVAVTTAPESDTAFPMPGGGMGAFR